MRPTGSGGIAVAVVLAVLCVTAAGAGVQASGAPAAMDDDTIAHAGDHGGAEPAFTVTLAADGSARVSINSTFDLTDEARAAAFEELRTNETAQSNFEARFQQRLESVAADASEATGREMAISDVDLSLHTVEDTGVVQFSFTWEGLAATQDGQLVVTEPFASGFQPDRPLYVEIPDNYEVASVEPTPVQNDGQRLTWTTGADLSGFELTATEVQQQGESAGSSGPGFTTVAALVALAGAALLVARRR